MPRVDGQEVAGGNFAISKQITAVIGLGENMLAADEFFEDGFTVENVCKRVRTLIHPQRDERQCTLD